MGRQSWICGTVSLVCFCRTAVQLSRLWAISQRDLVEFAPIQQFAWGFYYLWRWEAEIQANYSLPPWIDEVSGDVVEGGSFHAEIVVEYPLSNGLPAIGYGIHIGFSIDSRFRAHSRRFFQECFCVFVALSQCTSVLACEATDVFLLLHQFPCIWNVSDMFLALSHLWFNVSIAS